MTNGSQRQLLKFFNGVSIRDCSQNDANERLLSGEEWRLPSQLFSALFIMSAYRHRLSNAHLSTVKLPTNQQTFLSISPNQHTDI